MTVIDSDGDSQGLASFLHQQTKGAFAAEVESLKSDLRKERDSITMGMKSKLSRIGALRSKNTQLGVLESNESAIIRTGKIMCTTRTANMAAMREKLKFGPMLLAINGGSNADSTLTTRWTEHTN